MNPENREHKALAANRYSPGRTLPTATSTFHRVHSNCFCRIAKKSIFFFCLTYLTPQQKRGIITNCSLLRCGLLTDHKLIRISVSIERPRLLRHEKSVVQGSIYFSALFLNSFRNYSQTQEIVPTKHPQNAGSLCNIHD